MAHGLPDNAILVSTYGELRSWAIRFAKGDIKAMLVFGTGGVGKSRALKNAMEGIEYGVISGNDSAFQTHKKLFAFKDKPIVIDDADALFNSASVKGQMKQLLETEGLRTMSWDTKAMANCDECPVTFQTTSPVCVIVNEWKDTKHMRAVADRGIFLFFNPSVKAVHAYAKTWLHDDEVHSFVGKHLGLIAAPSNRYYKNIKDVKDAKMPNWEEIGMRMLNPDHASFAIVSELEASDRIPAIEDKVKKFMELTGKSRATYFRIKQALQVVGDE